MNNLKASMKKLLGNKNTVTILGILLCLVILAIGYNYRINSKVELVDVPYAVAVSYTHLTLPTKA